MKQSLFRRRILMIIIGSLMFTFILQAQSSIESSFGMLHSGKNLRFGYSKHFSNWVAEGGITCHFNQRNRYDSEGHAFYNRMHAFNWHQRIGAYAATQYKVFQAFDESLTGSVKLDVNFQNLGMRESIFENSGDTSIYGDALYTSYQSNVKTSMPHFQFSLAARFVLFSKKNLYSFYEAGVGTAWLRLGNFTTKELDTGKKIVNYNTGWTGDVFAPFLRAGVGWRLSK